MRNLFILLLMSAFLASCEEVIELDLKDSEPRLVIEANLNATAQRCAVQLSQSNGFYETGAYPQISGANIQLQTPNGTHTLAEVSPGKYETDGLTVTPGQSVQLTVRTSDQASYTASATVPSLVPIDSIFSIESTFGNAPGETPPYLVFIEWQDPAAAGNYYRMRVTRNGEYQSAGYIMLEDALRNGEEVTVPAFSVSFERGDSAVIELQSCDKAYYTYFNELSNQQSQGFSAAAPYNPVGNFGASVLGYFGVWQSASLGIRVQ